ncbi:MAG: hypothetical protein ABIL58_26505 [Pseudomonadota bacterium]
MGFSIETEDGIMVVRLAPGTTLTYELAAKVLRQQRGRPENLTVNDIWDTRGCVASADFKSDQVMWIVEDIRRLHTGGRYHEKSAMIVDSEESFGISRMFQILVEALPYEFRIFRDMPSAKAWIKTKG